MHVRISSPPFLWPCYFGTDIPEREQLIAYNRSIEEIRDIIGADTLGYLKVERLHEMVEGLNICEDVLQENIHWSHRKRTFVVTSNAKCGMMK